MGKINIPVLTAMEFAKIYGVHDSTIRTWVKDPENLITHKYIKGNKLMILDTPENRAQFEVLVKNSHKSPRSKVRVKRNAILNDYDTDFLSEIDSEY